MPRKSKSSAENTGPAETVPPSNGKTHPPGPKKKTRAPAAGISKAKKGVGTRKSPRKPPASPPTAAAVEPTDEQIRLRAYFLAERRHKLSLPGDSNHDWIEARRQLIEEAQR